MSRRLRVIGLIGGIGSGKSTIAGMFEKYGAVAVDADAIAHREIDRPDVRRRLRRLWGPEAIRRGRVDRAAVARRVFRSPADLRTLTRLLHPRIRREIRRRIAAARGRGRWVVVDAALLVETGTHRWCDGLVWVEAPRRQRLERVRRRGWTASELRRRERCQWPAARKRAMADEVIKNRGSRADLERQVRDLVRRWVLRDSYRIEGFLT